MSVLQLSSMKTLRMRSSSMPHVGTLMGPNKRTLFWRCKKDASEREYIWYPYTRGSENPSEKSIKKLVWAPLLSELLYDIRTFGSFVHFFWRCKKRPLLSENTYDILTRAGPKTLPKKCIFFGTGSRRGATPGRLGAQNRWLLKGFLAEGRLHRTCGRDRLGAHFAWSLLKKSQMSIEVFVGY